MSFIWATKSLTFWFWGIKDRGQVGVYFTKGPLVGNMLLIGVAQGVADARIWNARDVVRGRVVVPGQGLAAFVADRLHVDILVGGRRGTRNKPTKRSTPAFYPRAAAAVPSPPGLQAPLLRGPDNTRFSKPRLGKELLSEATA